MNQIQDQKDLIGKVIFYRNDLKGDKKIAVCGIAFPNTSVMKVTEYPINLKGEIYNASINLSKQKTNDKGFEETGDWYLIKEASEVERMVMEKINH